jgi:hypothetical protein
LKGGIVLLDPQNGTVRRILALQYNPDTLTRNFQIRGVGPESGDRLEALRLKGPPVETIKMEVEIDASDQLAADHAQVREVGLHSTLAALEVLIYPASATLESNNSAAASGSLEIVAAETPLMVFVFGPNRIVPVRLTEFSVTEEQFDISLNPVRAKLNLTMRVLTVDDLGFSAKGGGLFLTYLQSKEKLAARAKEGTFGVLGINSIT